MDSELFSRRILLPSILLKFSILILATTTLSPPGSSAFASQAALNAEFRKMAPGGRVDLDLVLKLGYQYSDGIKLLKTGFSTVRNAELRVLENSRLGGRLATNLQLFSDRFEQGGSLFAPRSTQSITWDTSYSKAYSSGTSIRGNFKLQDNDSEFADNPQFAIDGEYVSSEFSLGIRQSFLKNGFGGATSNYLQAARMLPRITRLNYESELAEWSVNISELYHQAWLAQKRVKYLEERVRSQKRLLKITRLSSRRGTAERADVLSVETQVMNAELGVEEAREGLKKIWRQLVIVLKIPERFLALDPMAVNLTNKTSRDTFKKLCRANAKQTIESKANPTIALLELQMEQLKLNNQADENLIKPELFADLTLASNGIDDDFAPATTEAVSYTHPRIIASVGFEMSFDNYGQRAQLSENKKSLQDIKLNLSSIRDQNQVEWVNACQEGERLLRVMNLQNKVRRINREREKLEEERFQLGRVEVRSVIAATNDLISANLSEVQARQQLAVIEWKLLKLHGKLANYVENLVQ